MCVYMYVYIHMTYMRLVLEPLLLNSPFATQASRIAFLECERRAACERRATSPRKVFLKGSIPGFTTWACASHSLNHAPPHIPVLNVFACERQQHNVVHTQRFSLRTKAPLRERRSMGFRESCFRTAPCRCTWICL